MRMEPIRPVDSGTLLVRALRLGAVTAGCPIEIESLAARPWSSATFTGTAHRVVLSAAATPQFDAWLAALPEATLTLRGHVVADLTIEADVVERQARRVALAVLTLVES